MPDMSLPAGFDVKPLPSEVHDKIADLKSGASQFDKLLQEHQNNLTNSVSELKIRLEEFDKRLNHLESVSVPAPKPLFSSERVPDVRSTP